jgi:flagellar motor switch protein FliM
MSAEAAERAHGAIRDLLRDAASLSVDQLPLLPVILDRAGGLLMERLRTLAPALPHVTLNALNAARIGDVLDSYDMRAIAGLFHVPAWDNRVIVGFDRDFVFTVMEMFMGGDGSEPPLEEVRNLSNIEVQISQFLFEQVGQILQTAFAPICETRFRFERSETRMDFAGAGRRGYPAFVARFILQALNRGGEMFVVIPQAALSPLRQALSRATARETAPPDPAWAQKISDEVRRTEVTIRAIIQSNGYTLGDIARLRVGQVLKLDETTHSRIKVESSEQPLFWAYLGQNGGLHTLRIDEAVDREQEFINDVLSR